MIAAGPLALPGDLATRVDPADFARLLGYPDRRLPAGRVRELAARSRSWYAREGRPWALLRPLAVTEIRKSRVHLEDGTELASARLARRLGGAASVVVAAVSAGPEVDAESARLWQEERPDAAYCLDRFGAAVTEYLAALTARHLRTASAESGVAALPGYSPGHDGWPLTQQVVLARCLLHGGDVTPPGPFEVLDSGMIRPKNSLLALFGLTRDRDLAAKAWGRGKCSWCSMARCAFRQPAQREPPAAAGGRGG
jgi:hypothetical protein